MRLHRFAIESGDEDELSLKDAVLYEATLEYIAQKANMYSNIFDQAAFLLYSIAFHHPFVQGNKRTAFLSVEIILKEWTTDVPPSEINEMVCQTATGKISEEEVREWLKKSYRKMIKDSEV